MSDRPRLSVQQIRASLSAASGRNLSALIAEHEGDERAGVQAACVSARGRLASSRRENRRMVGLYATERTLRDAGCLLVAGVDEVGRGALAGPMTAAAVILPERPHIDGLDDSKRLSPARREELAGEIRAVAVAVGIGHVSAGEIDSLGMTAALRRAIGLAIAQLGVVPDHIVLDGLPLHIADNETAIVKGDSKVAAIAAASIVAKVTRDALMRSVAADHPHYGFEVNKGYGTSEHLSAIARFGLSAIHRRSFSAGGGTASLF